MKPSNKIIPEQIMRALPIPAILSSMEMQIKVLKERGVEIKDWDNKEKTLKQIRMLGGKVYFFADINENGRTVGSNANKA